MKILLIGATGTIGSAVGEALGGRHEIIGVGRSRGALQVDLAAPNSIQRLFVEAGPIDAVVSTAGAAKFGTLDDLTDADYEFSVGNKLLGQINLVRFGREHLRKDGSFTLTSGILADQPNPGSTILSAINAGLHGFVGSAALQLRNGQRINAVSPPLVRETAQKLGWGSGGVPVAEVAKLYVQAVEGNEEGQVIGYPQYAKGERRYASS